MSSHLTVPDVRHQLGQECDDIAALRAENDRLRAELADLRKPKPRSRKQPAGGRTTREAKLLAEGKPPFKGALWFGHDLGWGIKRRSATVDGRFVAGAAVRGGDVAAYLANTGKTTVPAHDPAFGRR